MLQVLNSWSEFAQTFELYTYKALSDNQLINIKNSEIKKYFVKYLKEIFKSKSSITLRPNFALIRDNLFTLFKVFLCDAETGVYEITSDFLISFYLEKNLFILLSSGSQMIDPNDNINLGSIDANNINNKLLVFYILDYLDKVREKNAVLIVREIEVIFNFLEKIHCVESDLINYFQNRSKQADKELTDCFDSINSSNYGLNELDIIAKNYSEDERNFNFFLTKHLMEKFLFKLCANFYDFDLLTQLNFFDLAEKTLNKHYLIKIFMKKLDFFNNMNKEEKDLSDEIIRKALYTYSKLYGKGALESKNDLIIKNILAIAIQYFKFNNFDSYFILTVLTNCFNNKFIFKFLVAEESNEKFDFFTEVVNIIVESCWNHNPDLKKLSLELLSLIANFDVPSLFQDIFLKRFLCFFYKYEFNKLPETEIFAYKFFIQKSYKDFKLHDYEDYEFTFLETIYGNKL